MDDKEKRKCKICLEQKDITQFHSQCINRCLLCFNEIRREKYRKQKEDFKNKANDFRNKANNSSENKKCSMCEKERQLCFYSMRSGSRCVDCFNEIRRKHKYKTFTPSYTKKIKPYSGKLIDYKDLVFVCPDTGEKTKKCTLCSEIKPMKDYYKINSYKCKKCIRSTDKNRNSGRRESKQQWVERNRERVKENQANWFEKNKKKVQEKNRIRMKEDMPYRIKKICQSRLLKILKSKSKKPSIT